MKEFKKILGVFLIAVIISTGLLLTGLYQIPPYSISKVSRTQVQMIESSMQSVVQVIHADWPGHPASGFYIGNDIVVTAGHVAEGEPNGIIFEDGTEYEVLKSIVHPDYDCGFLLLHSVKKPSLKFDLVKSERGEELFILGNRLQLKYCVSKGIVSSVETYITEVFGEVILVQSDYDGFSGNSGSCVLDKDGEIRGVHVGSRRARISFFVPTEAILKALKEAKLEI
ncbi:hypothetical protein LCGC14_0947080 [marine sediment metagenome]|uniref:Serine protease n=1 Tax=marine sediment metagenome TaxID=412755 RepID=A0A0F9NN66_9ZZZZ